MNLDTTIDIDLKKFFRWWGGELAFLLPKALRRQLREYQGRVIFTPTSAGFEVDCFDDDGNRVFHRTMDEGALGQYASLKSQYPLLEHTEVVLRLPAGQALQKTLFLPLAVQQNLQQVVSFELDRYTPFKPDQVYFSAMVVDNTGHGQLSVLLVVVPQHTLDAQLKSLQAVGIKPHRVDYQDVSDDFPQLTDAYNLLPEQYQQKGNKLSQSIHGLLYAVLFLSFLAVLIWPVWMQGQAVDSLKARIKTLEKQNQIVEEQQTEIDALRAETQKLIDVKQKAPALLPVLQELSTLLNDDTWLTHMQFSEQHLQMQGQSPAASALIGVLEKSEFFSNVSFVSPLTQDKVTGRERFQISMDITMPVASVEEAGEDAPAADLPDQEEPVAPEQPADNPDAEPAPEPEEVISE